MLDRKNNTLLIGLGARFYRSEDRLYVEKQTISGLKAWQENFNHVIAFSILDDGSPPEGWSDAQTEGLIEPKFELLPLPNTYQIRSLRDTRLQAEAALLGCMKRATFRVFSYGGWIGDPGEIAAALARKHGLAHAVWLDRVESRLVLQQSSSAPLERAKSVIKSQVLSRYEKRAVRTADMALLHGATVYNHFQKIARNPHVSEDIHLQSQDRISSSAFSRKLETLRDGPLRILYCGRADPMKGGLDWVRTLGLLKSAGVQFRAKWIGDGSQLSKMVNLARQDGLSQDDVSFPGFFEDRTAVLEEYRKAHVFMFCHKTDESPRNLIESLHSATPIVGFRDAYAEGLVNEEDGGFLVDRGDIQGLAKTIAAIAADRGKLANLIKSAGRSASHLTREQVFKQRSDLIRQHLKA